MPTTTALALSLSIYAFRTGPDKDETIAEPVNFLGKKQSFFPINYQK
jgi:hypothetical protein